MNREKRKIKFKKKCCKREKIKIKRINKAELNKKISKYKKNVLTNIVIKMIKLHLMKIEISPQFPELKPSSKCKYQNLITKIVLILDFL